jgi:hypothetical protein
MEKISDYYVYKVFMSSGELPDGEKWHGYVYEIYTKNTKQLVRESDEWFYSEAQAGFAAIGHISLLENGEG